MSEKRESDYEQIATAIGKLGGFLCIGMIFIAAAIADGPAPEWVGGFGIVIVILILIGMVGKIRKNEKRRNKITLRKAHNFVNMEFGF